MKTIVTSVLLFTMNIVFSQDFQKYLGKKESFMKKEVKTSSDSIIQWKWPCKHVRSQFRVKCTIYKSKKISYYSTLGISFIVTNKYIETVIFPFSDTVRNDLWNNAPRLITSKDTEKLQKLKFWGGMYFRDCNGGYLEIDNKKYYYKIENGERVLKGCSVSNSNIQKLKECKCK